MITIDAATGPAQAQVSLSVLSRPAFTIARLEGELDIATVPALRKRLFTMLRPGLRLLIIDLSGLSFCDIAGLAVLVGAQRRARGLGISVRLAAPRPQMAKLLRVSGLGRFFTISATLDDALPMPEDEPGTAMSSPAVVRPARPGWSYDHPPECPRPRRPI